MVLPRPRGLAPIACFAYGLSCYALLIATLIYAVAFVVDPGLDRSLDAARRGPWAQALAIDLALVLLFALQHSVMARDGFKRYWSRIVPDPIERSTYVLCSCLALLLLFRLWQPLGGTIWEVESSAARILLRLFAALGAVLALAGTFAIDHFGLFGLRQTWRHLRGEPRLPARFATPGPYRYMRHPLYTGWLIAIWATPTMSLTHLVFALATSAYIVIGLRFEERDLTRAHAEYADYRRRVPALIPWIAGQRLRAMRKPTSTRSIPGSATRRTPQPIASSSTRNEPPRNTRGRPSAPVASAGSRPPSG